MEQEQSGERGISGTKRRRAPSGAAVMRADVTAALTKAFFQEWAERGLGALTLDAVSKRAGVGRAALYRRWTSKMAMAFDVAERVGVAMAEAPNTGSLEQDLFEMLLSFRRILRHPLARRVLPDMIAEGARNRSYNAGFGSRMARQRRARVHAVVQQAIARGELQPNVDLVLAADAAAGIIFWRMIALGGRLDRDATRAMARFIAAGLRA